MYKKNLLQQIRGFYHVVRCGTVSKAAQFMNLTQSTITLQIQSLERDLNLSLFSRDAKPLILTKEGEEFYQIACPLMHEFESVVDKFLNKKKEKEEKKIKIAVHHVAISYLMPDIVALFRKKNPQVKIALCNIAPSEAIQRLKDDEIDLAFYPNMTLRPEIALREVVSYDPVLIVNKKHPFAGRRIKSLKDFASLNLIRIDQSLITLPLFEEVVRTYKLKGSIEFENGNWEMLKRLVEKNNFAAVVSQVCLDDNDQALEKINLSRFFPKMTYAIATKNRKITRPIIEDFIAAIVEATAQRDKQVKALRK